MDRTDVRRRALRAAAAVTMTMTLLGCASGVDRSDETATEDPTEDNGATSTATTGEATAGSTGATSSSAASSTAASSAASSGASSSSGTWIEDAGLADAAEETVHCEMGTTPEEYEAYLACCDSVNWSFEAGCTAWGPPVPPAMRSA